MAHHEGICIAKKGFPIQRAGYIPTSSDLQFWIVSGSHRVQAAKRAEKTTWRMHVYHPALQYVHIAVLSSWILVHNIPEAYSLYATDEDRISAAIATTSLYYSKCQGYIGNNIGIGGGLSSDLNNLQILSSITPLRPILQYPTIVNQLATLFNNRLTLHNAVAILELGNLVSKPFIQSLVSTVFQDMASQDTAIKNLSPDIQDTVVFFLNNPTPGSVAAKACTKATLKDFKSSAEGFKTANHEKFHKDAITGIKSLYRLPKKLPTDEKHICSTLSIRSKNSFIYLLINDIKGIYKLLGSMLWKIDSFKNSSGAVSISYPYNYEEDFEYALGKVYFDCHGITMDEETISLWPQKLWNRITESFSDIKTGTVYFASCYGDKGKVTFPKQVDTIPEITKAYNNIREVLCYHPAWYELLQWFGLKPGACLPSVLNQSPTSVVVSGIFAGTEGYPFPSMYFPASPVVQPEPEVGSADRLPGTPPPGTILSRTPLPSTPLPSTPLPGTPLPGTPLPGTPLPGTPLPGTPLPGTPPPRTSPPPTYTTRIMEEDIPGLRTAYYNAEETYLETQLDMQTNTVYQALKMKLEENMKKQLAEAQTAQIKEKENETLRAKQAYEEAIKVLDAQKTNNPIPQAHHDTTSGPSTLPINLSNSTSSTSTSLPTGLSGVRRSTRLVPFPTSLADMYNKKADQDQQMLDSHSSTKKRPSKRTNTPLVFWPVEDTEDPVKTLETAHPKLEDMDSKEFGEEFLNLYTLKETFGLLDTDRLVEAFHQVAKLDRHTIKALANPANIDKINRLVRSMPDEEGVFGPGFAKTTQASGSTNRKRKAIEGTGASPQQKKTRQKNKRKAVVSDDESSNTKSNASNGTEEEVQE